MTILKWFAELLWFGLLGVGVDSARSEFETDLPFAGHASAFLRWGKKNPTPRRFHRLLGKILTGTGIFQGGLRNVASRIDIDANDNANGSLNGS